MRYVYVHRNDLRKWQMATLEIQQTVQDLFEQYAIPGWCGGGTLIGAVRNQGFLYWDNDLDMFFRFQDYRKIFDIFRTHNLFRSHDLVFFRNGYWQKYQNFMQVLKADNLDSDLMDFDLVELAKGMFKIFSRETISVRLFKRNFNRPEEYVQLQHYAPIHYTRQRLARQNIDIEDGAAYEVIPELCMLPMLGITPRAYLAFLFRYAAKSVLATAGKVVDFPEELLEKENIYPDTQNLLANGKFDKGLLNPVHARARLLLRNIIRGVKHYFTVSRQIKGNGYSGKLIAYRPVFFRFFVKPFIYEDILPATKMKFEDTTILVPGNVEAVLKTQFGDFRREPTIAHRTAYPFFFKGQI